MTNDTTEPREVGHAILAAMPRLQARYDAAWTLADERGDEVPDLAPVGGWSSGEHDLWHIATTVATWSWWRLDGDQAHALVSALQPVLDDLTAQAERADAFTTRAHAAMAEAVATGQPVDVERSDHA